MLSIVTDDLDNLVSSSCAGCDGFIGYYGIAVAVGDKRSLGENDKRVTEGSGVSKLAIYRGNRTDY